VAGFLVWGGTLVLGGWVSVASGLAACLVPVFVFLTRDDLGERYPWVLGLTILVAFLVLVRHWSNWKRIAQGREQPIWENLPETPEGGAVPAERPDARAPEEAPEPEPPEERPETRAEGEEEPRGSAKETEP
jgi:hypothetical protein